MKIAVTGKGGVGKTTIAASLARLYAWDEKRVLAVDADPDANLGLALGFTEEEIARITPIAEMSGLIAERTGSDKENYGKFFKINPRVDDIPGRFAVAKNGVKLLVMGTVDTGGGGCVCPEHVMLKRVISHLVLNSDDVVIMDMEAGIEHLGRGTAGMVDRFIVVVEPGARSLQTYTRIKSLAADLGVKRVSVVGNKIMNEADKGFISARVPQGDLLGFIRFNTGVMEADKAGEAPLANDEGFADEVMQIKAHLEEISADH
ncbi:MAG: AAA family ATPase [Clostridiales Family XIII bacterium]|jgi:CO dehydrogenase maturation factor|nr:AAA family ATPase [Clostridiales Family XIII bacterium]